MEVSGLGVLISVIPLKHQVLECVADEEIVLRLQATLSFLVDSIIARNDRCGREPSESLSKTL